MNSKGKEINLTVVVPAYNEAEKIGETLTALLDSKVGLKKSGINMKIFVVDDGSVDATADIAKKVGANSVIRHRVNRGLGAAIRTGLQAAFDDGADIVVKFDADLQHDPEDIEALVQPILNDEADVVYGNRFDKIEYKMPLVRRVGNKVFTGLMRWLTKWPLKDSQPGIFAVNRPYLEVFSLPGDYNYTQQILTDAYHKGMRFAHVSVSFRKRVSGKSFISYKYPFKVLPQILMILVSVKPLKVFTPVGLGAFFTGAAIALFEMFCWIFLDSPKPVVHVNAVIILCSFGLQTCFFGILAQLIIQQKNGNRF